MYFLIRILATGGCLVEPVGSNLLRWTEVGSIRDVLFRFFWLAPQLTVHYFKLILYPFGLIDTKAEWYHVGDSLFSIYSILCQVFVIGLIIISIWAAKKVPIFFIGITWFFISLVLTIQIIPLYSTVALRYCYMPSLALTLALFGLLKVLFKHKILNIMAVVFTLLVGCIFTIRTLYYLPSSKDLLNQYIYCAKEAPVWNKIQYLAEVHRLAIKEGRTSELPEWINEKAFEKAGNEWLNNYLIIKPNLATKYGPMQMILNFYAFKDIFKYLYESGHIEQFNTAIKSALIVKNNWVGWITIALFFKDIKQWDKSLYAFNTAVKMNSRVMDLYKSEYSQIISNTK